MMQYFNTYRTGNKVTIDDTSCATRAEAVAEHMENGDIYTSSGRQYVWTLAVDGDKVTTVNLEDGFDEWTAEKALDDRHDRSLRAGA